MCLALCWLLKLFAIFSCDFSGREPSRNADSGSRAVVAALAVGVAARGLRAADGVGRQELFAGAGPQPTAAGGALSAAACPCRRGRTPKQFFVIIVMWRGKVGRDTKKRVDRAVLAELSPSY
jgi:hypothetical protein